MAQGRIVIDTIESKLLMGNALGDPAARKLAIYLPPGYDANQQAYPTAYVLSGFTGRGTMLLNDTPADESMPQRLDRLINGGIMQAMIVVMPDCLTRLGGSQYINSSATGPYEDHLLQEVVPFVDATYRTVPDRNKRAVLGKSSGGYGSVMLAMRHPDVFGLMASHSGDMYFELCYKPDFVSVIRGLQEFGGVEAFLKNLHTIRPRNAVYKNVQNMLAMASCYSPNPESPYGFDLPFDLITAELDEAVWQRWLTWDPVYLAEQHADALRSLKLIYLDCGTEDEYNLQYGARIFCERLKKLNIAFMHEEFNDSHMNIPYRYDHSFKAISDAMGAKH